MSARLLRRYPHVLAASLCAGLAAANVARAASLLTLLVALACGAWALGLGGARSVAGLALALAIVGWWWGGMRLDALDRSPLSSRLGTAERALVVVTGPPRRGRFDLRIPANVIRFGTLRPRESALIELPLGRAPPQGARLEVLGELVPPHGPKHGFDERRWLRRHGVHVVLRGDTWRIVGRRGGLGGVADALRAWLARSIAPGLHGERKGVLEGVVLGDDGGLSNELRRRFRASGLYHLLAVSGQNVALVAAGALTLAWLFGMPRWLGELGALAGIAAYVMAVGAQPSVVRAGIAGALGSLAWLSARLTDRWYFLLAGAIALLAWNPYVVLDAGFELSFAAVAAIFVLAPRIQRGLEGYPVPRSLAIVLAVSAACGIATAPIMWLQFHAIPLLTIPANALAAPVVVPLLGLALVTALITPVWAPLGAALAWMNGGCAAYLAACARLVGGLPGAQIRSGRVAALLLAVALLAAAYAWPRWRPRPSSSPST